ncbi:MAG: oligoribonuclease [Gammaproteobacteria bacterium]|nr:oligoribonuclease [Gammaproteobacteria bacterium]
MAQDSSNLIWTDLEMTGLDTQNDQVIEIATIVTNSNLDILEEGPVIAIHQPDEVLEAMDEWNTRQHGQSGLVERVKSSRYSSADAERETLSFLGKYLPKGASPMCGNSICQDRRFMARLMPELEDYFHYRNLDVSTLKELANRWAPEITKGLSKKGSHLALDDIHDSIEELRYYRKHLLKLP